MDDILKQMTKAVVGEKILQSKWESLTITKDGESVGVGLKGQTFGLIAAVAAGIKAISESTDIPAPVLIEYVKIATEMTVPESKKLDVDAFMGYMDKIFKESK